MRRNWLILSGLSVGLVVALLGSAGAASGVSSLTSECNPDGRQFCIDITTYNGITASDSGSDGTRYTWVAWRIRNTGDSTLTNPKATVNLADYNCSAQTPPRPGPPSSQCTLLPQTSPQASQFESTTVPSGCSLSGFTLTCSYANIPAGGSTSSLLPGPKVYFKTANDPATHTRISVQATVKERGNDANGDTGGCLSGDPNCDTFTAFANNSYEPEPNAAYTFALQGKRFYLETDDVLGASGKGSSSFGFNSGSSDIFQAKFTTSFSACGTTYVATCFSRILEVNTEGAPASYNSGPVLFYGRLSGPPSGVNANNVVAIHEHDPLTFTVSANRFFTPPTGMDPRLDTVKIGITSYFVVGASVANNNFQLAATPGGQPLTTFTNGPVVGTATRVIGDQSFERSNNGCVFSYPTTAPFPPVPSICAKKVQGTQSTIDAWVWDSHNGSNKWG